jgi:hypothetical protein|tara:strand:- start:7363 stop:7626 length:264 start_codon:yes stop_codon:yes gene_type:complete
MTQQVFEIIRDLGEGEQSRLGLYAREQVALKECKRLNDRIIINLTHELATLNGAMRGSGRVRRLEIENILCNLPYSVNKRHVNNEYR